MDELTDEELNRYMDELTDEELNRYMDHYEVENEAVSI